MRLSKFASESTSWAALAILLLFIGGCQEETGPTASSSSNAAPAGAPVIGPNLGPIRTLDDEFIAMAEEEPGFAGLFQDPTTGEFYAVTTESNRQDGVRAIAGEYFRRGGVTGATVNVVVGEYAFRDLVTWRNEILSRASRWMSMADADEVRNRVVIGVPAAELIPNVIRVIDELGIPAPAVDVEVVPVLEDATTGAMPQFLTLQSFIRPVVGGTKISAGNGGFCTMTGVIVREDPFGTYHMGGQRYAMTNAHCTSLFGAITPSLMHQPSISYPNAQVGVEYSDPPLFSNAYYPECPPSEVCRYSDAALFVLDDSIASAFDSVAVESGGQYVGNAPLGGMMHSW